MQNITTTYNHNGETYQVEYRVTTPTYRNGSKWRVNTQAFINVADAHEISTEPLETIADINGFDTIHTVKGQCPELDAAWRKHNRNEVANMRAILDGAFEALGVSFNEVKFSKTAACRCGCSPCFVIKSNEFDANATLFINPVKIERETPSRFNLLDD